MEDNIFPKKDTYFAYIESEEELLDIVENIDEKLLNNNLDTKNIYAYFSFSLILFWFTK